MSEQIIIPAVEEAAAAEREAATAEIRAFLSQWQIEDMPACPVGMNLLFEFSQKQPSAYDMAHQRRFQDPPPMVARTPGWRAYAQHVMSCADCTESGAAPILYTGARDR